MRTINFLWRQIIQISFEIDSEIEIILILNNTKTHKIFIKYTFTIIISLF
jgi:hypothetical protein